MTDEPKIPSDDTPVTWGEMRALVKLVLQYQHQALLYTIVESTASIAREDDARAKARIKSAEILTKTANIAQKLEELVPGALKDD